MTDHLSDDVGFEGLFERLTAEFGPPTTPPQPDRRVAWWYSRLINIGLADHTVDDYGLRVHIVTPAR